MTKIALSNLDKKCNRKKSLLERLKYIFLFLYPHFFENQYNGISVPIDHSTAP